MKLSAGHRSFLAAVASFNDRYNTVKAGKKLHALRHPFWTTAEIKRAADIQEEWGVPKPLVPFYGDWHTVMCLDPKHGTVQLINDQRHVEFTWSTTKAFVQCLASSPEDPVDTSGIIESESSLDF